MSGNAHQAQNPLRVTSTHRHKIGAVRWAFSAATNRNFTGLPREEGRRFFEERAPRPARDFCAQPR
jgi:hypothetical protein